MATSLTYQTLTPARHKIAHASSREKLLPFGHKKALISRRPALLFIRGIETLPNAPFFPSVPPSFRLHFDAPILKLFTNSYSPPPFIPPHVIAAENLHPRGADDPLAKTQESSRPVVYWRSMNLKAAWLLLISGLLMNSCAGLHQTSAIDKLKPCASSEGPSDGYCGSLDVWENRQTKTGRKIALKIVVLPALKQDYAPDPLFFLAGGPGQGAASVGG